MKSYKSLLFNPFSHIYVEKDAYSYSFTQNILEKFKEASIITIQKYQDLFFRSNQDFRMEKESQKLILAVKRGNFIYSGPAVCQNFGHRHFYYTSCLINCLYDCEYCFLQGMASSANLLAFVNIEDFFDEAAQNLEDNSYLTLSYDSDILAFENIVPYTHSWMKFAIEHPHIEFEVRTKSANTEAIADIIPPPNGILAWTLSPENVIQRYEKKTPNLQSRISAIKRAIKEGWKVRLCFDPVIRIPDWQNIYKSLIEEVFSNISATKIQDVSIGSFRMNEEYFKKLLKVNPKSGLLYHPYEIRDGIVRCSSDWEKEMSECLSFSLQRHIEKDKIFTL